MSEERFTDVTIMGVDDGVGSSIGIYVIQSDGQHPPQTTHYDLQFVTCEVTFSIPGIRLYDVEQIGRAIVNLARDYKGQNHVI